MSSFSLSEAHNIGVVTTQVVLDKFHHTPISDDDRIRHAIFLILWRIRDEEYADSDRIDTMRETYEKETRTIVSDDRWDHIREYILDSKSKVRQ